MKIVEVSIHTEKGWHGFEIHSHKDVWQIDYFSKGEGRYLLNDYWVRIEKNSLFIIPPGYHHQVERNIKQDVENLSIKFVLEKEDTKKYFLPEKPEKIKIQGRKRLDKFFKKVVGYYVIEENKTVKKYMEMLFLKLNELVKNNKKFSLKDKLNLVKEMIEENYSLSKITLAFLAQKVNLNPQYLCRKYKIIMGKKIFSYLKEIRLNKSYHLILFTEEPLKKIAHQCGFKNVFYFTTTFKKYYKITPGELRRKAILQKLKMDSKYFSAK